jgi:hypothetical protein
MVVLTMTAYKREQKEATGNSKTIKTGISVKRYTKGKSTAPYEVCGKTIHQED